ncbi:MAG: methyltransferase domain-containing protein [Deltaproteobacteria bacterium]|nr:methyltransferase domain-containing protein [Deltaproteobacteria bacterium]
MDHHDESGVSAQDRAVASHFDELTVDFYMKSWNPDHLHFGLFEAGECPEKGEPLVGSAEFERGLERMIDVMVAPALIGEDHHVVDAGCGIGGTAIYLAKTKGCMVTGVNLSRKQLEIAEKKVVDAGLEDRIDLEYGNCSLALPFAGDSIDAVVNVESACHYSDRERFLREVRRVLKPGGRIVATDWLMRDGLTVDQHEKYIRPMYEPWAIPGLESRSTYSRRLRDAGLTVLEFEGFNGKDVDNQRLVQNNYQILRGLEFCGLLPAKLRRLMEKFQVLDVAWQSGCFELGRYCALKPE